jgi:hypothetical protein
MNLTVDSTNTNTIGYYLLYIFILLVAYIFIILISQLIKSKYNNNLNVSIDYYGQTQGRQIVHNVLTHDQRSLRIRFLLVATAIKAAVWVKAPYIFALYNRLHGFTRGDIGILYAIDNLSGLIMGPIMGSLGDMYGRKKFCVLYCIIVICHICLRLTGSRPLAYFAQFLTGVAGSLVETAFESWLNFEANFLFPSDNDGLREKNSYLREIFSK